MSKNIISWLANGETGISSKTMAFTALGQEFEHPCHPLDPSDLNRCIKLVDAAPEVKEFFFQISAISPKWAIVIDNWDSLRQMFIDEAGYNWSKSHKAEKTYNKMKELGL